MQDQHMVNQSINIQSQERHRFNCFLTFSLNLSKGGGNASIRNVSNVEAEKEEQLKANSHRANVVNAVQERKQLSHWTAEYFQSW